MSATLLTAIPDPQALADPEVKRVLIAIKMNLEQLASDTLTKTDIVNAGIGKIDANGKLITK